MSKKPRRTQPAPATASVADSARSAGDDSLRRAAGLGTTRDLIPWPVLAGLFAVVWVVVVYLQAPEFLPNWRNYQAVHAERKGDYAAAIPYLKKLHEKDMALGKKRRDHLPTYGYPFRLGNAYYKIGQYDEAVKWYTLTHEMRKNVKADDQGRKPPEPDFNTEIGMALLKAGKPDEAEKHLKDGLKFDRLDADAHFAYGELQFARGRYKEAVEHFKVVANNDKYKDEVAKYYAKIEEQMFGQVEDRSGSAPAEAGDAAKGTTAPALN